MCDDVNETETEHDEISLCLDIDVYNDLIKMYVVGSLNKHSNIIFNQYLSQDESIEAALAHAIVNETTTFALTDMVVKLEFADRLIAHATKIKERYTKNNKKDNETNDTEPDEVSR